MEDIFFKIMIRNCLMLFCAFSCQEIMPIFFLCGKYFVALHFKKKRLMEIIKTVVDLEGLLQGYRHSNKTIGLVPTMGALHDGHASLVRRCVAENDICVVSLFVNPTQFNNKEDLQLYPRTPEKDFQLLETIGADVVFFLHPKRRSIRRLIHVFSTLEILSRLWKDGSARGGILMALPRW